MSDLERTFEFHLRVLGQDLPAPTAQHPVVPNRKFRFDFAWPRHMVAVEIDGGTFSNGRHVRPIGFRNDCEKLNLATIAGWRVLRFTADMLTDDPQTCIDQVRLLLSDGASTVLARE